MWQKRDSVVRAAIWSIALMAGSAASLSWGQEEVPILALDAGGHTAIVNKLMFTPDGKELISVSDDKTIRFWDVASGQTSRILRPPIGAGSEGMVYAGALSPNGEMLAVAGYAPGDGNPVYLISLKEDRITRLLEGHTNVVQDLDFSADGRLLVSGSNDDTARVWNVETGETVQVLSGHQSDIYGVAFSPNGDKCTTASYDHTAGVWSVATGELLVSLKDHEAEVHCIDWSPDGKYIVTGCDDHKMRVWSPDGTLVRTVDNLGAREFGSVRFTPDSQQVLYVQGVGEDDRHAGLLNVATGETSVRFFGHSNSIFDAQLSPDGQLIASAGGNDKEILLWRPSDGELISTMVGKGQVPWSAAWSPDGSHIAWGNLNEVLSIEARSPIRRSFNLLNMEHGEAVTEETEGDWHRATFSEGAISLVSSGKTTVDVRHGVKKIATLQPTREYNQLYDTIRCFSMLGRDRAAVGSNFNLRIYNTQTGEMERDLIGHSGVVWAISTSPDGRYLLSASNDMTLRVWDVNAPGDVEMEPLLSLFFADQEWIAWTPQGYYDASPGGERLMGWHVNNGLNQLASFLPASQFHKQFYRPDVIRQLLRTGSVERALKAAGTTGPVKSIAENLPPEVEIISPSDAISNASSEEITVRVRATRRGTNPIKSLQLLIDGRPLNGQDGIVAVDGSSETVTHSFHVPLVPGVEHGIVAKADDAATHGLSNEIRVIYESATASVRKPTLYVLAIGVAAYDDDSLRLDFADDDARNLADVLQERSFGLFEKIDTRLVVDKDATQKGILGGLVWLKQQMTQHDIGVLFYSGHGAKDETGNFFFLPSDVDTTSPLLLSAVSDSQVKSILQGIPGRLMVMLDACHAGGGATAIAGGRRKNTTALTDDLVRELSNDDYGVVVMASSMSREFSLESPDNQSGMFALALCEGLDGKADYNQDRQVLFTELDVYVADRVKELSDGKQHPVTAKPATIRPFPLSLGK
ncbi:MAG: caspase family protein [Planctomycetaceae bacterium]|nr:caspase family protein [Planctomycetaceae bacterium]